MSRWTPELAAEGEAMGFRRGWVLLVLVAVGVAGCAVPGLVGPYAEPPGAGSPPDGAASSTTSRVTAGEIRIVEGVLADDLGVAPAGFTVEEGALSVGGRTVRLAHPPMDALAGGLVPEVVPTFDGSAVYYTMWESWEGLDGLEPGEIGGVPVIRRVEVATGADEVFRRGSYAAAVSVDGRVGYVEDLDGAYRYSVPNPTRVRVALPDGSADQVWSTGDDLRYVTVGWAGGALLAYQVLEGEYPVTFAFYGPGESRLLSDGGVVVAISPDGSKALLVEPGAIADKTHFVVVDPTDGSVLASADFSTPLGPVQGTYAGDWVGDRIVVGPGAGDGDRYPYVFGFAILTYREGSLSLERFVTLDEVSGMVSLTSPRFTPEGNVWLQVTVVMTGSDSEVWNCWEAVCDPESGSCQAVTLARDGGEFAPVVDNWSGGGRP